FQAEAGIRAFHVTGVQTCALPILHHLAGTGRNGYAGDGGPARQAVLAGPKGIALGPGGDIYLADTESHTIRVIRSESGIIETLEIRRESCRARVEVSVGGASCTE